MLPEPEREVFDLLWYEELSQSEAAVVLDVSERTMRLSLERLMASAGHELKTPIGALVVLADLLIAISFSFASRSDAAVFTRRRSTLWTCNAARCCQRRATVRLRPTRTRNSGDCGGAGKRYVTITSQFDVERLAASR
jgi:signal transduction histidine kinase